MLLGGGKRGTAGHPACEELYVHRVRYANSAAKFWPALLDEVEEILPGCSRIELITTGEGPLTSMQLYPELELERDLERLATADIAEVMQSTLAMIGITGPPPRVRVQLFRGNRRVRSRLLPADCVDAEIFSFLLAWLLRWACIPESCWNDGRIDGRFTAEDRRREKHYDVAMSLANEHLAEGLYRRTLALTRGASRPT